MADVQERLLGWVRRTSIVRAAILTSMRARPEGPPDELSDWDVILAVTDPSALVDDLDWHAEIGAPLVRWGDEDELLGHPTWFRGVVYDDGSKVDFTIWPDALLDAIAEQDRLPPGLDHGHSVLHDPDGRTSSWPPPTFSAYVLSPPTEADYRALVEEFWWDTTYVAKAVRRGELFFATSFVIEHDLKLIALRRMLEWRTAAASGWTFAPGVHGRGLERRLDAGDRALLQATYATLDADGVRRALAATIDLFRRAAIDVGHALGYRYPEEIDGRMTILLATTFDPPRSAP
jgi:aminoglycoside 6-adenylyltransferase